MIVRKPKQLLEEEITLLGSLQKLQSVTDLGEILGITRANS